MYEHTEYHDMLCIMRTARKSDRNQKKNAIVKVKQIEIG